MNTAHTLCVATVMAISSAAVQADMTFVNKGSEDISFTVGVDDGFEYYPISVSVPAGGTKNIADGLQYVAIDINVERIKQYMWPYKQSFKNRDLFDKLNVVIDGDDVSCSFQTVSSDNACETMFEGGTWDCNKDGDYWAKYAQPLLQCQY